MKKLLQKIYLVSRYALLMAIIQMSFNSILMATDQKAKADIEISGTVTDENGDGLPGASVVVRGTTRGTTTDLNGKYKLTVPDDGVITISFVGYVTLEIEIGTQTTIDVQMIVDAEQLEEVVVVGYGTQKKKDVTGSLVTVDSKILKETPAVQDVSQALKGRIAGVDIVNTGSTPGSGTQIRIRGNRSLGSHTSGVNNPLIVLDGIPFGGTLNDINPNDIKSVSVLKDASATAIYGSRGANGVVLITTNRGLVGPATLRINSSHGFVSKIANYDVFSGDELLELKQWSKFGGDGSITADELDSQTNGVETNWQDLLSETGYISSHDIGVSGGTEETKYNVSFSFFDQTSIIPDQSFERYSIRANLDQKVGERFQFGLSLQNTLSFRAGDNVNPFGLAVQLSPYFKPYEADGVTVNPDPAAGHIDDTFVLNPLLIYENRESVRETRRLRLFNSAYGEFEIIEGLKYRLNLGLDFRQEETGVYRAAGSYQAGKEGAPTGFIGNGDGWTYLIENVLKYSREIDKHKFGFTGLFSVQEDGGNFTSFSATNITSDANQYFNFNLAESTLVEDARESQSGIKSYMGRMTYTYDDRFSGTLTFRTDGSSRLAEGNKWASYAGVAGAWNVHNEVFMQGTQEVISNLKLRVGWGRTSNQAINPYASLGQLGQSVYNFGDAGVYGYSVNTLPNENLGWEFTISRNLGIDFGLFTNKVFGSIDIYHNTTDDVLQSRALPITSGISGSFQENIGKTQGKGIELMLSSEIIEANTEGGFTLGADFNMTRHRGKILALAGEVTQDIGNGWFVGESMDVVYDYEKIGIWQLNEDAEAQSLGYLAGDIKVKDLNDDGVLDADDRRILGNLDPSATAGLTIRSTYKGFDFSIVSFARFGGLINAGLFGASLEGRRNQVKVDYWTPENPTNAFPRSGDQFPRHGSTLQYFSGTFLKIRSINLGYSLPNVLLEKIGVSQARVYFTANTPFQAFFSDFVDSGGLDPETNTRPDDNANNGRLEIGAGIPAVKQLIFGLNLTF